MIQSLLVSILFVPLPSLESDIVSLQKALDNKAQYDMAKEQTIESFAAIESPHDYTRLTIHIVTTQPTITPRSVWC